MRGELWRCSRYRSGIRLRMCVVIRTGIVLFSVEEGGEVEDSRVMRVKTYGRQYRRVR